MTYKLECAIDLIDIPELEAFLTKIIDRNKTPGGFKKVSENQARYLPDHFLLSYYLSEHKAMKVAVILFATTNPLLFENFKLDFITGGFSFTETPVISTRWGL